MYIHGFKGNASAQVMSLGGMAALALRVCTFVFIKETYIYEK